MEDEFGGVEAEDANVVGARPRVRLVGVDLDPVVADAGGRHVPSCVGRASRLQTYKSGSPVSASRWTRRTRPSKTCDDRVPVLVAADVGADGDAGRQLGRLELVGEERDRRERGLDDGDRLARFEHEAVGAEARLVLGRAERRVRGGGRRAPAEHARLPQPPRAPAYLGSVRCSAEPYASARGRVAASTRARRARPPGTRCTRRAAGRPPTSQPARDARACARRVSCSTLSDSRSREKPRIHAASPPRRRRRRRRPCRATPPS